MSAPKRRLLLTHDADDDLHSIALYGLLNWGGERVAHYHAKIAESLEALTVFPYLGQRRERHSETLRVLVVGQHHVYYRVEPESIVVLRILHARLDTDSALP